MQINRKTDAGELTFTLTSEELHKAYEEMQREYDRLDFEGQIFLPASEATPRDLLRRYLKRCGAPDALCDDMRIEIFNRFHAKLRNTFVWRDMLVNTMYDVVDDWRAKYQT